MKTLNKVRFIPLLLTLSLVAMMAVPTISMAANQAPVNLGTTSSFAVLAHSTITNTGPTTINGDAGGNVGLYSGTSVTGFPPGTVSGIIYASDPGGVALAAQNDLVTAYNDAAGRTPVTRIPSQLGGTTLYPGTYDSADGTFQITGTLTLDALGDPNNVFVFKTASTLTTASGSNVILTGGARYCRTFWQVGSSATLGTNSHFVGHIFAMASITATTGATVQGQLLARTGAVTLDTNTITNGLCATMASPAQATLHVIKHVNGGTAVAADFLLYVKTSGSNVSGSPAPGAESPGITYTLDPGAYVVSEAVYAGYTASYSVDGANSTNGNIALASGTTNTVTITNTYTPTIVSSGGGGGAPLILPFIKVIKTPSPTALTGSGSVTYTYTVTNPGTVALSNVSVTDNKVSPVSYVSGDVNHDNLLQPTETWIYTGTTNLDATTTNTATAKGSANGNTATGIASATVVVTSPVVVTPTVASPTVTPSVVVTPTVASPVVTSPVVVTRTVTGGQIPKTSTPFSIPMYELLLIGAALTLFGAVGWRKRKRYE